MENQTRYDLNAAIEGWRQELVAQANLTDEVRRELETHLRDAITGFQQRGLNDEESFWLARQRVGRPHQLGEEFVKANPAAVWRERVRWMAAAVLAVSLWTVSANGINFAVRNWLNTWLDTLWNHGVVHQRFWQSAFFQMTFSMLLRDLPILLLVVLLLRGSGRIFAGLAWLFQSRRHFVIPAAGWLILNEIYQVFDLLGMQRQLNHSYGVHAPTVSVWTNVLTTAIWPLALIVLIAWLLPAERQKAPRYA